MRKNTVTPKNTMTQRKNTVTPKITMPQRKNPWLQGLLQEEVPRTMTIGPDSVQCDLLAQFKNTAVPIGAGSLNQILGIQVDLTEELRSALRSVVVLYEECGGEYGFRAEEHPYIIAARALLRNH